LHSDTNFISRSASVDGLEEIGFEVLRASLSTGSIVSSSVGLRIKGNWRGFLFAKR
jgi:hypothetical protein